MQPSPRPALSAQSHHRPVTITITQPSTTSMLPFTCGIIATLIPGLFYLVHLENMNRRLLHSVRQAERRKAYAQGYRDRALLANRQPPESET